MAARYGEQVRPDNRAGTPVGTQGLTLAWTDPGRRVQPALVLTLLVALAGRVVMAAVVRARRIGTAVERHVM
jgi:hypothetical protein